MSNERVLSKIKKCLALSQSANEHEAALALKQARKLMDLNGLSASDITDRCIHRVRSKHKRYPKWAYDLTYTVGVAFGCSSYIGSNTVYFIGKENAPEIAGYTYEVLARQLELNKKEFLAHRRTTAARKRKIGQAFAEGWVYGVHKVVAQFASPLDDAEKAENSKCFTRLSGRAAGDSLPPASAIKLSDKTISKAACHGFLSGGKARLSHGVDGSETLSLENLGTAS